MRIVSSGLLTLSAILMLTTPAEAGIPRLEGNYIVRAFKPKFGFLGAKLRPGKECTIHRCGSRLVIEQRPVGIPRSAQPVTTQHVELSRRGYLSSPLGNRWLFIEPMKLKMTEIWQRQPSGDVIITTTKWAPLKRLLPRRDTCILEPFGLMRTWQ